MNLRIVILGTILSAMSAGAAAAKCPEGATQLFPDLARSGIKWRGTKFWGLGKHEGTVQLKSGALCVANGRIIAGSFIADMRTIDVTDIPADDPIPRKRLRDHLLSEDFFHVSAHPEARLVIVSSNRVRNSLHQVTADLTMRGRTHRLTFYARVWEANNDHVRAQATLPIERHKWGVSYVGSDLRDDLVDDTFQLDLTLETRPGLRAGPPN
jgi:polyisoprenoid-binding protein YceI